MNINDPLVVAEVTAAFNAYEKALMTDDLEAMGLLFWESPHTVRLGVAKICTVSKRSTHSASRAGVLRSAICCAWRLRHLATILR